MSLSGGGMMFSPVGLTPPNYGTILTSSAAGGTLNNAPTDWDFVHTNGQGFLHYSGDIPGPFGGSRVFKQPLDSTSNLFGGIVTQGLAGLGITNGDDLWIRMYTFFPAGFCFSEGAVSGDGWDHLKWFRFDTSEFQHLYAIQIANMQEGPTCGTIGWCKYSGWEPTGNIATMPSPVNKDIVTGVWHSIQAHVHLGQSTVGWAETWLDDVYIGRFKVLGADNYTTIHATEPLQGFVLGDYWNGAPINNTPIYIDELIVTDEQPNTTDSGGRPFIHPSHQISDFT